MGGSHSSGAHIDRVARIVKVPVVLDTTARAVDGVHYAIVDGPSTTAAKGSTAAQGILRLKTLRHPNILAFSRVSDSSTPTTRKGSVMGLPLCRHLPEVLKRRRPAAPKGASPTSALTPSSSSAASPLDAYPLAPSEVLYGLQGIAEALAMCARAGVFFSSLAPSQVGVAMASSKCHPVNSNRWVLLDFTTADGADAKASAEAFIAFVDAVCATMEVGVLEAAVAQRWFLGGGGDAAVKKWEGVRDGNPFALLLRDEEVIEEVPCEPTSSGAAAAAPAALDDDAPLVPSAEGANDDGPEVPGCGGADDSPIVPQAGGDASGPATRTVRRTVSTAGTFFSAALAFIASLEDPLLAAIAIGHDLPQYYAADSASITQHHGASGGSGGGAANSSATVMSGVSEALNSAYERLDAVIRSLSQPLTVASSPGPGPAAAAAADGEVAAGVGGLDKEACSVVVTLPCVELHRCVFPWLLAPEHLAQPVSSHLFTSILTAHGGTMRGGRSASFTALIRQCMHSCDPLLNARLCALSGPIAPLMSTADLFLMAEGICYTCFHTSAALAGEWATLEQLRYCRASVKAAEHVLAEMAARCGGSNSTKGAAAADSSSSAFMAVYQSTVEELSTLLFACIGSAEAMSSDYIAEVYRVMRESLLGLAGLIPVALAAGEGPAKRLGPAVAVCKRAVARSLYGWSLLTREQCINVVVGCIGTAIPLPQCGFILACMLSLCGCEENSIRNAACTGLLRLKESIGGKGMGAEDDKAVIAACGGDAHSSAAGLVGLEPVARLEGAVLAAFVSMEQKRLSANGYGEGSSIIATLGKERAKAAHGVPSDSAAYNAVFRTGNDKATHVAVLFHAAY